MLDNKKWTMDIEYRLCENIQKNTTIWAHTKNIYNDYKCGCSKSNATQQRVRQIVSKWPRVGTASHMSIAIPKKCACLFIKYVHLLNSYIGSTHILHIQMLNIKAKYTISCNSVVTWNSI